MNGYGVWEHLDKLDPVNLEDLIFSLMPVVQDNQSVLLMITYLEHQQHVFHSHHQILRF